MFNWAQAYIFKIRVGIHLLPLKNKTTKIQRLWSADACVELDSSLLGIHEAQCDFSPLDRSCSLIVRGLLNRLDLAGIVWKLYSRFENFLENVLLCDFHWNLLLPPNCPFLPLISCNLKNSKRDLIRILSCLHSSRLFFYPIFSPSLRVSFDWPVGPVKLLRIVELFPNILRAQMQRVSKVWSKEQHRKPITLFDTLYTTPSYWMKTPRG